MQYSQSVDPPVRRRRVSAMAPDERRAALVEATLPLLREHGMAVSTRQIARAAGVAEGTIFGVFPDKFSLLRAAVIRAFDPQPVLDTLAAIDPGVDLRARLTVVADVLARRFTDNEPLLSVMRCASQQAGAGPHRVDHGPPQIVPDARRPGVDDFFVRLGPARERILAAVAATIAPDAALLRRGPETTARLLFSMVLSATRGVFDEVEHFDPEEIVGLLLDGVLIRPPHPTREAGRC